MSELVRWIAGDGRPQWKRRQSTRPMGKRRVKPLLRFGHDVIMGAPCWICVGHRAYGFRDGFPIYPVGYGNTAKAAFLHWRANDRRAFREWQQRGYR